MKIQKKQFDLLNAKLDKIIKLLATNIVKDMKYQKEKIIFLYSFEYKPAEIAKLLNTTSNTVSVTVNEAKKEGRL